jgi:photosystem II stability/assembly factor-like uncharacterized protein
MSEPPGLQAQYDEARAAIAAKDFGRAADLLKRILASDEDYKDASRLLAQIVAQQRHRWYRDWRLGGAIAVIALSIWLGPKIPWASLRQPPENPAPGASPTGATGGPPSSATAVLAAPTQARSPFEATPVERLRVPLSWTRLSLGQQFSRDAIAAIVVDPTDSDVLYVGTKHAGIYKSIDGGLSWRPAHNGLGTASIASLAIDPTDPGTLYAGTLLGGVYTTSDGGDHWNSVNVDLRTPTDWSNETSTVVVDPLDSRHYYYLDPMHIYETWAGSDRWQSVFDGEAIGEPNTCRPYLSDMVVHPGQPSTLLVLEGGNLGCTPGIYTIDTASGGRTLLFGTGPSEYLWELEVDRLSGTYIYVTGSDEKGGLIYSSSDGGETWLMKGVQNGAWPCRSITVSPTIGEIAYCATDGGLYGTSDGGQTWRARTMWPYQQVEQYVEADGQRIFLAQEGLSVSQDGGASWEPRQEGLGATFLQLKLRPNRTDGLYLEEGSCIIGTRHDTSLYVSQDGGFTWALEADRGCGAAFSLDGELIYRVDPSSAAVLRSLGGGVPWTVMPLSESGLLPVYLDVLPIDQGALFVASHGDRLGASPVISHDNGTTWVSTQLREGRLVLAHDRQVEAFYAFWNDGVAYRSTTKGASWSDCETVGFRPSEISTQFALVHALDSEHVLVGTRGGGVLVSRDGCGTWRPSNHGLGSLFVNALAADPNDPDVIYAGTDGGAFVSFDGGVTWDEINEGLLGATVVYSIVVDPESIVYAATPYGVFQLEAR